MVVELYKPFIHQKDVHKAITDHINTVDRFTEDFQKTFVVKAMRQVGKSALAENELLRFALEFNASKNGYIAPTFNLSKKTYRELKKILLNTGLVKNSNGSDLIIELINGSTINFFSAEQGDNLRGFTISGLLVVDEAAFIKDDVYSEHISPWTDFHKAVTLIISTPKFYQGFFYNLYLDGLDEDNLMIDSFDWSNYDLSFIRSDEMLEAKRKTMPLIKFQSEYLGLFIKGEGSVFSNFNHLVLDGNREFNMNELYFGLDWATGSNKDSTVLIAFNGLGELCYIWATNNMQPTQQIEYIVGIIKGFGSKVKGFIAEENSIGKVYLDMLKKNNIKVTAFNTTNKSKRKLVEDFQVAIEQNLIKLIKNDILALQLSSYESKVTNSGNMTYNAPDGMNDDYVIASMLAYKAYKERKNNIRISFI